MAKSDGWVPLYLKQGRRSPASPLPHTPTCTPALLAKHFFHTSSPFPLTVDVFSFLLCLRKFQKYTEKVWLYGIYNWPQNRNYSEKGLVFSVCLFARIQHHGVAWVVEISTCIFVFCSSHSEAFEFFSVPRPVLMIMPS